jgi:glycosyltransferase involved in cell wall biosynthesis
VEPRFAVTLTTRNNAPTIRACLASIRDDVQGLGEIVVVDAASTDGTAAILAELAGGWPELRVVEEALNRGRGRNRSVELTRAPVVLTQVDADNVYRRGSLRAAAEAVASGDSDLLLVEGEHDPNPSCTRCYGWKRAAFDRIGGYPPVQYEEDLAIVREAIARGLKIAAFRVDRLGDDLKERGVAAYQLPAHRRLPAVVRAARMFRQVGYRYPEYVRFLWLTRRGAGHFAAATGLGAYAYLRPNGPTAQGGRGSAPAGE